MMCSRATSRATMETEIASETSEIFFLLTRLMAVADLIYFFFILKLNCYLEIHE